MRTGIFFSIKGAGMINMPRRRFAAILITILAIVTLTGGAIRARAAGSYVVQPGDTLFSIASRFNVSVSELATINGVYDVNALFVGQVLNLPNPLPAGFVPAYPTNPNQGNQPFGPVSQFNGST